jgi:hypothetical protein
LQCQTWPEANSLVSNNIVDLPGQRRRQKFAAEGNFGDAGIKTAWMTKAAQTINFQGSWAKKALAAQIG